MNPFVVLLVVFLQGGVLRGTYGTAISPGQEIETGSRGKLGAIWGPKEGLSWTDDIAQDDDSERFPEDWVISGEDWQRKKRSPLHHPKFKWNVDQSDDFDEDDEVREDDSKKKGQWSSFLHSKDKHRQKDKNKKADNYADDYENLGDKNEANLDNPWPNVSSAVKSFKGDNSRYSKNWDSSPKHMRYAEQPLGEKGGMEKSIGFDEDYGWGSDKKDEPMLEGDSYWLGGFAAALRLVLGREMAERTALAHQPPYVSLADVGKSINEVCAIEKKKQAIQDNERLQRIMRKLSLLSKSVNSNAESRAEDLKINETTADAELYGKLLGKMNFTLSDAKNSAQAINEPDDTTSSIVTASIMKTVAPQVSKEKISSDLDGDKVIFSKPVSNSSDSTNATRAAKTKASKESISAPRRKVQARKTETETTEKATADRRLNPRAAECTFHTTLAYTVFTCPGETTTCPFCPQEEETLRYCPLEPSDAPPRATRRPPNMYHVAHLFEDFGGASPRESRDIKKARQCGECAKGVVTTSTQPPRVTCKKDWRTETPWPVATKRPPNNYHVAHGKEPEISTPVSKIQEVGDVPPRSFVKRQDSCGKCGLPFLTASTTQPPRVTCKKDWRTETPWPVATKRPPNNYHVAHAKTESETPASLNTPKPKDSGLNFGRWLNKDFDYSGDLLNSLETGEGQGLPQHLKFAYNKDNDPIVIDKRVANRLVSGSGKM